MFHRDRRESRLFRTDSFWEYDRDRQAKADQKPYVYLGWICVEAGGSWLPGLYDLRTVRFSMTL